MKKILAACVALLCFFSAQSQSLTQNVTTMNSGETLTITATGESNSKYFRGEEGSFSHIIYAATPNTYLAYQNIEFLTHTAYSTSNPTPSVFTYKLTNYSEVAVVVTVRLNITSWDAASQSFGLPVSYYFNITVQPGQGYPNVEKTATISKNNCSPMYTGSSETYVIPAGTYFSHTSQAAADALAQTAANNGAQAYANANGTCSPTDPTPYIQLNGPSTLYKDDTQFVTYSVSLTGPFESVSKNVGWLQMPQGWNVGLIKGSFITINPSPNAVSGTVTAQVYINGQWYNKSMYVTAANGAPVQP